MIADMSAAQSKKIKPSELFKGALPYANPVWDFTSGVLPPTVSFTRASTGWRYNSSGVLVPETTDAPRYQYDPVTLAARGLLVEDASAGLFTYSEQFDNAAWTKARATVTANAIAAPDGATTADKLVEDGSAAQSHYVTQTVSFVAGSTYAFSVFAKADTRSFIYLQVPAVAFGSNLRTWFDVGTGAIGTTPGAVTAFIQNVGGGWYRCVAIATATVTISTTALIAVTSADGTISYNGDGVSGLYIWGANMRTEDRLTSYVQVVASPVVRAADVGLITNTLALADQCWVVKGRTPRKITGGAINVAFQVDDGTANNARSVYYGTDGRLYALATVGGVSTCVIDLGAVAANTDFAVAVRWADNDFAASLNGGAIVTDTIGSVPTGLTTARIGRGYSTGYWNSTIRSIETRRTATDADLISFAA